MWQLTAGDEPGVPKRGERSAPLPACLGRPAHPWLAPGPDL